MRCPSLPIVLALCGGLVSLPSGCAGDNDSSKNAQKGAGESIGKNSQPSLLATGGLITILPGEGFSNAFIPQQVSSDPPFRIEFNAAARNSTYGGTIDGVIGLSNGPASAFSKFGPIVRFNSSGTIDVRKGGVYTADATLAYRSDYEWYHFVVTVNLAAHTYSVSANEHGFPAVQLATDYAFRSEQATVARLDNVGFELDSPSGSMQIVDVQLFANSPTFVADSSGWSNRAFPAQAGHFQVELLVRPITASHLDAVIGLSNGVPGAFSDLAAAVRFAPSGLIDARNGGQYAYDNSISYQSNGFYWLLFDIDVPSKKYSVAVRPQGSSSIFEMVASHFSFRTQQSTVPQLAHVGAFVDTSEGAEGVVYTDNLTIEY